MKRLLIILLSLLMLSCSSSGDRKVDFKIKVWYENGSSDTLDCSAVISKSSYITFFHSIGTSCLILYVNKEMFVKDSKIIACDIKKYKILSRTVQNVNK